MVSGFADFAFARQEHEDVALLARMQPQFIDCISNRVVQVVVFRFVERFVALLHRKHAARHLNNWRRHHLAPTVAHFVWLPAPHGGRALLGAARRGGVFAPTVAHCVWLPAPHGGCALLGTARRGGVFAPTVAHFVWLPAPQGGCALLGTARRGGGLKMPRKPVRVNRGRRHDDFQIGAARQDLLQVAQQKIDVQRAFMRLVDDEGVIGVQQRVSLGFGQQNAVGHQLHRGVAAQFVSKPHLVTHHLAQRRVKFLGDAFGYRAGRDAPRLGMANQFAALPGRVIQLAAPQTQRNFGQLGGFARTGFTTNDYYLVFVDQFGNFFAPA